MLNLLLSKDSRSMIHILSYFFYQLLAKVFLHELIWLHSVAGRTSKPLVYELSTTHMKLSGCQILKIQNSNSSSVTLTFTTASL